MDLGEVKRWLARKTRAKPGAGTGTVALSLHITSQITNLKKIRHVVGLRECYQCGGETLDPVVKH